MKGNYRRPEPLRALDRRPGPRQLQRRHMENLYAKADVGSKKPRPPVTPQESKKT